MVSVEGFTQNPYTDPEEVIGGKAAVIVVKVETERLVGVSDRGDEVKYPQVYQAKRKIKVRCQE